MTLVSFIKHEASEVLFATIYFAVCFLTIAFLKALFLKEYNIAFYGYSGALIGALIVAKVLVVMKATTIGKRFKTKKIIYHVLYQSVVYTFWVFVVVALEHLFHIINKSNGFSHLVEEIDMHLILAKSLCVFISFLIYHIFQEINNHLGEGVLRELFLMNRR